MKVKRRLILISLLTMGLVIGFWFYNSTITPLDRPFILSSIKETVVATRVDWMCNCANFVDTMKYNINPTTEPDDNDYFFVEPSRPDLILDREHFINYRYVRLTGQFYLDKGIPAEFEYGHIEDKPKHAKVFKVEKIEYLTN